MSTHARLGRTLAAMAWLGTGCMHAAPTPQLLAARRAVQEARAMGAAELEPAALDDAERMLSVAEAEDDGSRGEAHFAYLADRRARVAMAEARRDRIEQGTALETRVLEVEQAEVATLDAELLFETGSAELDAGAPEVLTPIVEELRRSSMVAVVSGFTDSTGSAEENRELSQRRAEAVCAYFAAQGVPPARLVAEGHGESDPIAANDTEAGRASNRRVEVALYPTATGSLQPPRALWALAAR